MTSQPEKVDRWVDEVLSRCRSECAAIGRIVAELVTPVDSSGPGRSAVDREAKQSGPRAGDGSAVDSVAPPSDSTAFAGRPAEGGSPRIELELLAEESLARGDSSAWPEGQSVVAVGMESGDRRLVWLLFESEGFSAPTDELSRPHPGRWQHAASRLADLLLGGDADRSSESTLAGGERPEVQTWIGRSRFSSDWLTSLAPADDAVVARLRIMSETAETIAAVVLPVGLPGRVIAAGQPDANTHTGKPEKREPQGAGQRAGGDPPSAKKLPGYARSLLRVEVPLRVVLASKRQPLGRVVELCPGAIIGFDKMCDEALDLMADGRRIATGEAVKVGDKFGLRILSICLPEERYHKVVR